MAAARTRIALFLFFFVFAFAHPLKAETDGSSATLDDLLTAAMQNNPDLYASEARWQKSVEQARQAGVLEDPMMMLRIQSALIKDPLDFTLESMTGKVVGISQKLPFYGKRSLMREEAVHAAEAERWLVEERRLELRRMIKETWFQIYFIDRSLETVDANRVLLDDLIRLAESMYSVGKTGQQEVFQAQLERSKLEETRLDLVQKRQSLAAKINALAYRPVASAVPLIPLRTIAPLKLSAEDLEKRAIDQRPVLKALLAQIDKAKVGTKLAEKEVYPDVTVSLEYMQRDPVMGSPGDDMYSAGLIFNLPVQADRRHAKIAESQAEQRVAVQELAATTNQIHLAIADTLAQLERNRQLIGLYEHGIITQARGSVESAMAAYRNDKAKFTEVLNSRVNLFNFEREYHQAVAGYEIQLAALENVIGGVFPSIP